LVRAGKDLRPFDVQEFNQFEDPVAQLGRLLWLLALAEDTPVAERVDLRQRWSQLFAVFPDVGPVLTPMLPTEPRSSSDPGIQTLAAQLAQRLDVPSAVLTPHSREKSVERWTLRLIREGGERLRELGALNA